MCVCVCVCVHVSALALLVHQATDIPDNAYVAVLLSDLDHESVRVTGRAVESIFIGGGTPSLFSVSAIPSPDGGK